MYFVVTFIFSAFLQEAQLALEELKENQSKPHPRVVHLQEEIEQMKVVLEYSGYISMHGNIG